MLSTMIRAPLLAEQAICTAITQVLVSHNVLLWRWNGMLTGMQARLVPRIVTLAGHTTLRDDKHPDNFNCTKSSLLLFAPASYKVSMRAGFLRHSSLGSRKHLPTRRFWCYSVFAAKRRRG
jgi:hypothetical protein